MESKVCVKKSLRDEIIDLLEDHPFEIMLSSALILFGMRALISGLQSVPGSIQLLPIILAIVYCVLSVLGGSLVIFGLSVRYRFAWAYGFERAGLFISASAWASYVVGISFSPLTAKSTLIMLALLALSVGYLLRARAINRRAKATLIALRQAKIDKEESE